MEYIPEFILSVILESISPVVNEDQLAHNQVYKRLRDSGSSCAEKAQGALRMARTGDAGHGFKEVQTDLFSFLHEAD